jgi:Ca2+-binding EF-hand superfamily protein
VSCINTAGEQNTAADAMQQPVDFDSFSKVLNRAGGFRDPGEPEEYCRGFQVFDKDMTGFIGVGQLRYSMTSSWTRIPSTEKILTYP